ncbi:MAG: aminotransferase [Xanthobacteraceae bacterium]|nr:aminotransferase [Xanthobacteraceae bacterium]
MHPVFANLPTTVFEVMSRLAREHDAINLGQGFPDDPGPEDVRRKAAEAVVNGWNQYPPMMGLPELRAAVAKHYAHWQGVSLDPESEVMITSGATEALTGAILTLIEPGDEVVLFQPLYDSYLPMVKRAGGIPKLVRLEPPHWRITEDALKKVFTKKTKAVLFNNPHNPAGVVYSMEDLTLLARFCNEFDAVAICDEVWEHVVFDGRKHVSMLSVPSMRERTVKIGSAGKIFCLTGWKVGFVCAAPALMRGLSKAHQFITFTTPPNLQAAVAYGLGKADDYFLDMRSTLAHSRDRFAKGLRTVGFDPLESQGTYFINVDLAALGINERDSDFCQRLVTENKVAAIPVSAFYAEDPVTSVVRFCFAKHDATLDGAIARMANLRR